MPSSLLHPWWTLNKKSCGIPCNSQAWSEAEDAVETNININNNLQISQIWSLGTCLLIDLNWLMMVELRPISAYQPHRWNMHVFRYKGGNYLENCMFHAFCLCFFSWGTVNPSMICFDSEWYYSETSVWRSAFKPWRTTNRIPLGPSHLSWCFHPLLTLVRDPPEGVGQHAVKVKRSSIMLISARMNELCLKWLSCVGNRTNPKAGSKKGQSFSNDTIYERATRNHDDMI